MTLPSVRSLPFPPSGIIITLPNRRAHFEPESRDSSTASLPRGRRRVPGVAVQLDRVVELDCLLRGRKVTRYDRTNSEYIFKPSDQVFNAGEECTQPGIERVVRDQGHTKTTKSRASIVINVLCAIVAAIMSVSCLSAAQITCMWTTTSRGRVRLLPH